MTWPRPRRQFRFIGLFNLKEKWYNTLPVVTGGVALAFFNEQMGCER